MPPPPPSPSPLALTANATAASADAGDCPAFGIHQHQHLAAAAAPIFSHARSARPAAGFSAHQYQEQLYHPYHRHQYPNHSHLHHHHQEEQQQQHQQEQQQQQQQQHYQQQLAFPTSFTSVTPPDLDLADDVVLHGSSATSPPSSPMAAVFVVKGQLQSPEYGTVGRG
uniref:Uncharacterized protein n=1 Tax=Anopheles dirus TaxID=7168 RepID=A0A182N1K4_9DIPT